MKLINYYVAIIAPILIFLLLWTLSLIGKVGAFMLIYFVYRAFLDFYKLKSNGVVTKKDIWKFIIPMWSFVYFKQLYFQ